MAFGIAYESLYRVKKLLQAEAYSGDHAELLRMIGDHFLNLAYDWAEQFEHGAVDYSRRRSIDAFATRGVLASHVERL